MPPERLGQIELRSVDGYGRGYDNVAVLAGLPHQGQSHFLQYPTLLQLSHIGDNSVEVIENGHLMRKKVQTHSKAPQARRIAYPADLQEGPMLT